MKKVLVITGTHVRENEYSHAVADRLVEYFGKKSPDFHVKGVDGAREADVWDYENLSVAKISKVGETSEDYLRTLDSEQLIRLAKFKLQDKRNSYPGIDSIFGGKKSQWTSVNDEIVSTVKPYFFIDLHSYHKSNFSNGTGMIIIPRASKEVTNLMGQCLLEARKNEPEIYGSPIEIVDPSLWEGVSDNDLVNICLGVWEKVKDHFLKRMLIGGENENILFAEKYAKNWYLGEGGKEEEPNSFTFEAVHWQEKQQAATVNFMVKYLLPILNTKEVEK